MPSRGRNQDQIEKLLSKPKHPSLNFTCSIAVGDCASNKTADLRFKQLFTLLVAFYCRGVSRIFEWGVGGLQYLLVP